MVVVDASILVVTRVTPLVPLLTLVLRGLVPSTARNTSLFLFLSLFSLFVYLFRSLPSTSILYLLDLQPHEAS